MHVRIEPWRNTFHEKPLTELVELGERLTTKVSGGPNDKPLELQSAESVPKRGVEDTQELAEAGLSSANSVPDMNGGRESVDQCAVQVEEPANTGTSCTSADLGDGLGG